MSTKVQHHLSPSHRGLPTCETPFDGAESLPSIIRLIETEANQIRDDAADIEDARFLAENIIDICRHVLADETKRIANAPPINGVQTGNSLPAEATLTANTVPFGTATARSKLECLSSRELEIFAHLAEGRSAAEIAVQLSRSSKTINNHRTRILRKLGLKNATELVRLALQSGLISV